MTNLAAAMQVLRPTIYASSVEYIEEMFHEDGSVKGFTSRKKSDMQQRLANSRRVFDMWYTHKRYYSDYEHCVDPAKANPRQYNMFAGRFPLQHLEPPYELDEGELALIEPVLAHYEKIFGEGDPEGLKYLRDWFALPLQQVGTKTYVAIVIRVRLFSACIDGQPDTEHADSAALSHVLPEASLPGGCARHVKDEGRGCVFSLEDEQIDGGDRGLQGRHRAHGEETWHSMIAGRAGDREGPAGQRAE